MFSAAIASSHSKLLLVDKSLITDVLNSNNDTLKAEDLTFTPHDRCFLEFSSPVELFPGFNSAGVAVYKSVDKTLRGLSWLGTRQAGKDVIDGVGFHILVVNGVDYEFCNVNTPEGMPPWEYHKAGDISKEYRDLALRKTKNLWDFLTCRNLDYQTYNRPAHSWTKIKKYKHLSGMKEGIREIRTLCVNRTILRPDSTSSQAPEEMELPYRISIPGAFHKWVYCRDCGKVHRHDLIGSPCRRCQLQVGPFSNIIIKKYWHPPHFKGPENAPMKEVVRKFTD
jgi:hypothetical protein